MAYVFGMGDIGCISLIPRLSPKKRRVAWDIFLHVTNVDLDAVNRNTFVSVYVCYS